MMMLEVKWVATGLVTLGASRAFLLGLGEFIWNEREYIHCLF